MLFDVDDDDGGFDFSDHGETGTDDAPFDADAWDDVLNAFDALSRRRERVRRRRVRMRGLAGLGR